MNFVACCTNLSLGLIPAAISNTRLRQALSLLELLVVWTKDNRHIPYSSFQSIMNTHTETTAESRLITRYIAESPLKFKRLVQPG